MTVWLANTSFWLELNICAGEVWQNEHIEKQPVIHARRPTWSAIAHEVGRICWIDFLGTGIIDIKPVDGGWRVRVFTQTESAVPFERGAWNLEAEAVLTVLQLPCNFVCLKPITWPCS